MTVGGAERQLCGLAFMLSSKGHEVMVVSYRKGDFFRKWLEDKGIRMVDLSAGGDSGSLAIARRLSALLREEKVDVAIAFTPGPGIKACMAKKLWGGGWKLIVSERNHKGKLRAYDLARFMFYRCADRIVTNSDAQYRSIRGSLPRFPVPVSTIVNYVDLESFTPVPSPASGLRSGDRDSEEIRIVCCARVSKRKNLMTLIKAAGVLRRKGYPLSIDWWGSVKDGRYLQRCMKEAEAHGIGMHVKVHPATDDPASAYRGADLFCLPSFYEGTPNTLAEAMASGLPVAASDVSDNARYCIEGVNGAVFDPSSEQSLADALERIVSCGRERMEAYGRESRSLSERKFSPGRFVNEWISLLESLLQQRCPTP